MRVIVTRPAAQADDWVARLQARGIDAVALPLIGIAPVEDGTALDAAWLTLQQRQLVVFVSPNAAAQFFARRAASSVWPGNVLAASPGPGTTRLLVALGVPVAQIVEPAADAAQFDSESLWLQLSARDWRGADVLIVRGDVGRDWLADTLRSHGARVATVAAYRRVVPSFDARAAALLRAAVERPQSHLWFFSSSEAIDNLAAVVPPAAMAGGLRGRAIATHPRIAERARQRGFAPVIESRPALDDVVACIQSLRP
ncbi:MAG: uroporphyrinogen-III synthase [Burkholderiales bacterium]|nr:uroporphyrinogen-III synthase [Burkholderiales bacterium]